MSNTKDSARPDALPEEPQVSATTPETPPGDKAELADADLDKVSGGALGSSLGNVVKSVGDGLTQVARKG